MRAGGRSGWIGGGGGGGGGGDGPPSSRLRKGCEAEVGPIAIGRGRSVGGRERRVDEGLKRLYTPRHETTDEWTIEALHLRSLSLSLSSASFLTRWLNKHPWCICSSPRPPRAINDEGAVAVGRPAGRPAEFWQIFTSGSFQRPRCLRKQIHRST